MSLYFSKPTVCLFKQWTVHVIQIADKTELQTHTTQFDNPNLAYWVVSAPAGPGSDGQEKGGKGGLPPFSAVDSRFHDDAGSMRAHAEYHQLPLSSTDDILLDDPTVHAYNEVVKDPHYLHYQHQLQPQYPQPQYYELQHSMYADIDTKTHNKPS